MLTHAKDTPGTRVYVAGPDADNPIIRQLYLTKGAMGDATPKSITVIVRY
jgi:hypothetical protein